MKSKLGMKKSLCLIIGAGLISFQSMSHAFEDSTQSYKLFPQKESSEQLSEESQQEYLDHAVIQVTTQDQGPLNKDTGIVLIPPVVSTNPSPAMVANFSSKLIREYLDVFSLILVFGEKVWNLVEENAAVLTVDNRSISVLPNILDQKVTPMDLENWKLPIMKDFHFTGLSNFGNVLADMSFSLQFSYGGSHSGKGQYLAGVNIIPTKVYVKWSNKFEVKSELKSVVNLSTKENPLVAATIEVTYKLTTPFSERLMSDTFTVIGDGQVVIPRQNNSTTSEFISGPSLDSDSDSDSDSEEYLN